MDHPFMVEVAPKLALRGLRNLLEVISRRPGPTE